MATSSNRYRQALAELVESDADRSHTAQIRELYDLIEQARASGVSRTDIHQKLVDAGMKISLRNFDQALYRIRKSNRPLQVPDKLSPGASNTPRENTGTHTSSRERDINPARTTKPAGGIDFKKIREDAIKSTMLTPPDTSV